MIVACIPAHNEEKTIARVILEAQKYVSSVIVCDDGSTDLTGTIAHRLGALVIHHEENLGYGAALRSLFKKAKEMEADVVLTLDADGQHDPGEIPNLIEPVLEHKADIVFGSRFLQKHNRVPTYRRFGIKLLTKMSNGSLKNGVSDAQCGFRVYNKAAIQKLELSEEGMGISAEILRKAKQLDLRIAEVPVQVNYKTVESSSQNPVSHGLGVLSTIIRLVVEERPLLCLGVPGAILLAIGVGFGIWTLQLFTIERRIVTNVALASISFALVGIFTLFTAITLYAIARLFQKQAAQRS
ncbi:MAG TPA: glycosyltransferase family 2 protein [Candidatus Bathyarchaeia archaeon]|nr:glycosyltransferase family 2 protein [Candidatus Bathyarchaeia archaeon]